MPSHNPPHALTIDVEDWVQSVFDGDLPLTDRFVRNTDRVLEHLHGVGVRATFFVLGLAAEKSPRLVRDIRAAGHEVQSHGYAHCLITRQTPQEFRDDILRSKAVLEDLLGEEVTGYRAPAFSITRKSLWALSVLVDCGFRYDSSIVPAWSPRYGLPGAPRTACLCRLERGASITEIPVATFTIGRFAIPMGGGGYLRLFPAACIERAIEQVRKTGHPTAIYLHPYELAPEELGELRPEELGGRRIPLRQRIHQGLGRRRVAAKLGRLLERFRFGTVRELIAASGTLPTWEVRSLRMVDVEVQAPSLREPILSSR